MNKYAVVVILMVTLLQSCYEESNIEIIEPKKGWEIQDSRLEEKVGLKPDLSDVFFLDEHTGWAIGSGVVVKTTDGGQNWKTILCPDINQYGYIHFTSKTEGWAIGFYSRLMHTTDGGETWQRKDYPAPSAGTSFLHGLYFNRSGAGGFLGSSDGRFVYITQDNGVTWTSTIILKSKYADYYHSIHFTDNNHAWISGERLIEQDKYIGLMLYSSDGGRSWQEKQFDSLHAIGKIYFLDNQTGWAISKSSTLLHTRDGGLTWVKQATNTTEGIIDFHFTDHHHGWLIENMPNVRGGTTNYPIFKVTNDGGVTWRYQDFSMNLNRFSEHLKSIYFVNPDVGYAVGTNGAILKTMTGGNPE